MRRARVGLAALCSFGLVLGSAASAVASPPEDAPAEDAPTEDAPTEDAPAEDAPTEMERAVQASPGAKDTPADAKQRARVWFEKAVAEAKAERFGSAGEAFDASYAAIPRPNTLFNAAWAYDHASDWVRATLRYRSYLARYPDAADSEEVERSLLRVETEVAELRVVIVGGEAPLTLKIDDINVAIDSPPQVLMPGPVRVEVRDATGQARTETLTLRGGQRSSVELTLSTGKTPDLGDPKPGGPETETGPGSDNNPGLGRQLGPKDPSRTPAPRRTWVRPALWSSLSLAGAGGIGVAVLGPLTLRESKRFEAALCESPCPSGSSYPAQIETRWRRYRAGTNAMISVAAVGATGALVFGLLARKRAKDAGESAGDAQANTAAEGEAFVDGARVRLEPSAQGLRLRF